MAKLYKKHNAACFLGNELRKRNKVDNDCVTKNERDMRKMKYFIVAMVIVGFAACMDDDDDDDNAMEGRNKAVINEFAYSNNAEVNMGTMAASKGLSATVKNFGQMMVTEHQKAQSDLDTIADKRDVDLPSNLRAMDNATRDSVNALTGAAFDSAYIKSQIVAHTRTQNMFIAFRDSTSDAGLKAYVNRHLPSVQKHLQKADSIFTVIKNTK